MNGQSEEPGKPPTVKSVEDARTEASEVFSSILDATGFAGRLLNRARGLARATIPNGTVCT
jgi:hypothetical protein